MAHTEKGTYCRQGWPVTSPSRWTPVCWTVDHLRPWPDWGRMPLWVWGCHLKHLNQKGAGQRERKGKEMDGRVRGWGRGEQNRWRHNTTKIKTNTQQHIQCTHMDRENMLSMNEAESKAHIKKKNSSSPGCVRRVCWVNSPSHAYAMQKAKAPGRECD